MATQLLEADETPICVLGGMRLSGPIGVQGAAFSASVPYALSLRARIQSRDRPFLRLRVTNVASRSCSRSLPQICRLVVR